MNRLPINDNDVKCGHYLLIRTSDKARFFATIVNLEPLSVCNVYTTKGKKYNDHIGDCDVYELLSTERRRYFDILRGDELAKDSPHFTRRGGKIIAGTILLSTDAVYACILTNDIPDTGSFKGTVMNVVNLKTELRNEAKLGKSVHFVPSQVPCIAEAYWKIIYNELKETKQ